MAPTRRVAFSAGTLLLVVATLAGGCRATVDDETQPAATPTAAAPTLPQGEDLAVSADDDQAGNATPTPGLPYPDGILPEVRWYADSYGVSVDEAVRRMQLQEAYHATRQALREAAGGRSMSVWLQHEPDFSLVVWLHGDEPVPSSIDAVVVAAPGPVKVRTGARYTLDELLAAAQGASRLIFEEGGSAGSAVDEMRNVAWVQISSYSIFAGREDELRARLAATYGDRIELRVYQAPSYPPPAQPSDWLPRTRHDGLEGDSALGGGTLVREGNCLYAEQERGRMLLLFPRPREVASFDDTRNELTLYGVAVPVGARITFGGSGGTIDEGTAPSTGLHVPADPACDTHAWWFVFGPPTRVE